MSSCNKTPVAVLHELCVRRNIVEQYNLVSTEGTANDPLFEMSVETSTGLIAHGKGQTKKEAKHNAAQAALNQMQVPAIMPGLQVPVVQGNPSVVNPHKDKGLKGNSVGRLQEHCAMNGLPTPTYELTGDEGEPHERTFCYKCEVSQRYEIGIGRTKMVAKHKAAQAMYETLTSNTSLFMRDMLPTSEITPIIRNQNMSQEEQENQVEIYSLCRPVTNVPTTNPGLKFSNYNASMRNILSCVKEDLMVESFPSPIESLEAIAEKISLTVSYHVGQDSSGEPNNSRPCVFAVVNTQPTSVQMGEGQSVSEATVQAALNVIKYWQIFVDFHPVKDSV